MGRHLRDKPRILLDCDGILSDFTTRVTQLVNEELGTTSNSWDITIWDFAAALGLDAETAFKIKRKLGATEGFAASILPYPGAADAVRKLKEIADVYVVTSPWNSNKTWVYEREAWLLKHFGISHRHVMHGSAKYLCAGDFFVDDKVEHLELWQAEHPDGVAVKWKTLHNPSEIWSGVTTNDWNEILRLVENHRQLL
jgi:5'(3')-deoxyribonucleotidase